MSLAVYEAIVVNAAPDGAPKGHITVRIPELFGTDEVPLTIAPLYNGWAGGGWHGVPSPQLSRTDTTTEVRVMVMELAPESYRWFGSSQGFSDIEDNPGTRAGARSPDADHYIYLDNTRGCYIVVSSDQDRDDVKNYLSISPADDAIRMGTYDGSAFILSKDQVALMLGDGSSIVIDRTNGIGLVQAQGKEVVSIQDGKLVLMGTEAQMTFGALQLASGVVNIAATQGTLATTVAAVKADTLYSALGAALTQIGGAVNGLAPGGGALAVSLGAQLSAMDPTLLSNVLKHT